MGFNVLHEGVRLSLATVGTLSVPVIGTVALYKYDQHECTNRRMADNN